jgi:hypothetical protein
MTRLVTRPLSDSTRLVAQSVGDSLQYWIKTKHILAGSVSLGLDVPRVAGSMKLSAILGVSNPGHTSLQVCLLYDPAFPASMFVMRPIFHLRESYTSYSR